MEALTDRLKRKSVVADVATTPGTGIRNRIRVTTVVATSAGTVIRRVFSIAVTALTAIADTAPGLIGVNVISTDADVAIAATAPGRAAVDAAPLKLATAARYVDDGVCVKVAAYAPVADTMRYDDPLPSAVAPPVKLPVAAVQVPPNIQQPIKRSLALDVVAIADEVTAVEVPLDETAVWSTGELVATPLNS